ncbi:MAG TPA: azurin [Dokdonella sp.]
MLKTLFALGLLAGASSALAADCSAELEGNDMMQYNKNEIDVPKSCKEFTINLKHPGSLAKAMMGHNVVIAKSADVQAIASDGSGAGLDADYVKPGDTRVVAHSKVIGAGETTSVTFPIAKIEGDDYAFFCSFPGHYSIMKGTLKLQ